MSTAVGPAVVVPVKDFSVAKGRLADALDSERRAELAERMAAGVLAAAGELATWVVCDDDDVAAWAADHGAGVIRQTRPGLNGAVAEATDVLAASGCGRVIVAHGDLPLARDLTWVGDFGGVTIVPDRRGDGTNVMSVPTGAGFEFAYGVGSAERHRVEAERLDLPVLIVADDELSWDVDTPDDLTVFETTVDEDPT